MLDYQKLRGNGFELAATLTFILVITVFFSFDTIAKQLIQISTIISAGFLMIFSFLCLRRLAGADRRSFYLFAGFSASWLIAELYWTIQEEILHTAPYPSVTDLFWFAGYLPLIVFFSVLLKKPKKFITRNILILSGVISFSLLIPLLASVAYHNPDLTNSETLLVFIYPILDAVVLSQMLVGLTIFAKSKDHAFLTWIMVGLMAIIVADTLFYELIEADLYTVGNTVDMIFNLGYFLMFIGVYKLFRQTTIQDTTKIISDNLQKSTILESHNLVIPTIIISLSIVFALVIMELYLIQKIDGLYVSIQQIIMIAVGFIIVLSGILYLVNKNLTKTIEKLEKTDRMKNEFLSMISHELKTPLVPIKTYLDLLIVGKFGSLNEMQLNRLRIIKQNSEFLNTLVSDLVDAQKIEIGELKLARTKQNLKLTISEIITNYMPTINQKNISLETNLADIECYHDVRRLSQVISNLLSNAIDFCPQENGKITVTLSKDDINAKITVKDNGKGIEESNIYKIFVKFYQEDTSNTREHGGQGLGLAVCKGIIELHQGKIWIESEGRGKGAEVHISLPIASEFESLDQPIFKKSISTKVQNLYT